MKPKRHIESTHDPGCRQARNGMPASLARQHDPMMACASPSPARPEHAPGRLPAAEVQAPHPEPATQTRSPVPGDLPFRRNPTLEVHRLDTGLLLTHPATGHSRRLDPLGAFAWYLLKDPTTLNEAIAALQHIRPDLDPARVRTDTEDLFHALHTERMIFPDHPPSA